MGLLLFNCVLHNRLFSIIFSICRFLFCFLSTFTFWNLPDTGSRLGRKTHTPEDHDQVRGDY